MADSEAVTIADAAAYLKASTKFVRARIADKSLPAYRIAGSPLVRILKTDLDAMLVPVAEKRIKELVAAAPEMSDEQINRIRLSLHTGGAERDGAGR